MNVSTVVPKTESSRWAINLNFILCRFLRRLEQSLKQRERFTGAGNSDEEGDESSSVTSPLLQPSRAPRPVIRKSQSIGRLQPAPAPAPPAPRQKGGELLHTASEGAWRGSLGMAGPNDISDWTLGVVDYICVQRGWEMSAYFLVAARRAVCLAHA